MRTLATKARAINQYNGLGNQLWDLAGNRPSLDLRFADDKSLVDATTGTNLVDHTRASSGTYVGSDGLIKTATTNLIWPSEDFTTTWGVAGATRVADAGIAPNGTLAADRIESTGGGVFRNNVSVVSGVPYTYSVYIKHVSGTGVINAIGFEQFSGVSLAAQTSFNVLTGTVVSNGSAVTASSITPVGNGWYRVSVRATSTGTTAVIINYTSVSGNQFLLWGAQLEHSSTVGEYIPTTSTINSAPRFDHDPETGESLGLLVEESRTNLLLRSEEFDQSPWTINFANPTANAVTAPDGKQTADLLTSTTSATYSRAWQLISNSGSTVTASCYLRSDIPFTGSLRLRKDGVEVAVKNINIGTSWERFDITDASVFSSSCEFHIFLNPDGLSGVSVSGRLLYLWGAQLEAGSFPTSYIPTEGSTVTRAADVASITGTNFSSWYRQDEGTVFADSYRKYPVPSIDYPSIFDANDGTTNNRVIIGYLTETLASQLVNLGGVQQVNNYPAGLSGVRRRKTAGGFRENDFYVITNGVTAKSDTSGTMPSSISQVDIGINFNGLYQLNGTIRRLTYWPQRLPNSTLSTITQ